MTVETAADRASLVEDFGINVTLTPAYGLAFVRRGIFDAAFVEVAERVGTGVAARGRAVTLVEDAQVAALKRGDSVTADGTTWRVTEAHPDGTGVVHLILEVAT